MAKLSYFLIFVLLSGFCGLQVELDEEWEMYKETFNKTYNSDCQEKSKKKNWEENLEFIIRHNMKADMGVHNFTAGLNEFSDMSFAEFSTIMVGSSMPDEMIPDAEMFVPPPDAKINASVDYRKLGMVTKPGNQGTCGSCYAFCSCACLEAMYKKNNGTLIKLSVQNIVDCSQDLGNKGCFSGSSFYAMMYALENEGLNSDKSYPYEERVGRCRFKRENVVPLGCSRLRKVKKNDETVLKTAVGTVGPVAVFINAISQQFQNYKKGIFYNPCCKKKPVNHCVTIVGYGATERRTDYWIIKNSWGTSWGEKGFCRMYRGSNICNVTAHPVLCL